MIISLFFRTNIIHHHKNSRYQICTALEIWLFFGKLLETKCDEVVYFKIAICLKLILFHSRKKPKTYFLILFRHDKRASSFAFFIQYMVAEHFPKPRTYTIAIPQFHQQGWCTNRNQDPTVRRMCVVLIEKFPSVCVVLHGQWLLYVTAD